MEQKIRFLVLLAAGLLCLNLIPICWAEDPMEDVLQEDLDVEDELDPGFVGAADEDEELEAELQDEAPPTPKTPPVPKVRLKPSWWTVVALVHQSVLSQIHWLWHHRFCPEPIRSDPIQAPRGSRASLQKPPAPTCCCPDHSTMAHLHGVH